MKKNRKTKKQKLRAEIKKKTLVAPIQEREAAEEEKSTHVTHSIKSFSLSKFSPANSIANSAATRTKYSYVVHDVRNTLTILAIILAANTALYILIQQGIIKLAW